MKKTHLLALASAMLAGAVGSNTDVPSDAKVYAKQPDHLPLLTTPNFGVSPKDYGIYLLRSGKNKYNDRKRKHYAKQFS